MSTPRDRVLAMRPWNPNPLMRRSDRIESWIRIVVAAVCLATAPIAGSVGIAVYTTAVQQIRVANAAKIEVVATVVDDPEAFGRTRPAFATVRWRRAGVSGTAIAPVPSIANRGDRIRIWLDADERPTTPPIGPAKATTAAIRAAAVVLLGACGVAVVVTESARWCAIRYQSFRWDQRWRRFDRPVE
ncbi:hypothetical protein AB0M22_21220 [Nocardia sp. NPDC051756]|uniref:Rv1733c family protein n=1 Tax=Nocardia sp. NPDC051756 TaxID=3154751 RepID=UPI00341C30AB